MRDDSVLCIPLIDHRLEYLNSLPADFGAAEAPDEFFALAGEHGSANDFDPADVACDKFHTGSCQDSAMARFSRCARHSKANDT